MLTKKRKKLFLKAPQRVRIFKIMAPYIPSYFPSLYNHARALDLKLPRTTLIILNF